MPNDKTPCISLHEILPGVPEPSCLGPWTGNQEPKALSDNRARTFVLSIALQLLNQHWMVLLGPWPNGRGYLAQSIQLSRRTQDRPPYHKAPRLGPRPFSISLVNSFGGILFSCTFLFKHQFNPCIKGAAQT